MVSFVARSTAASTKGKPIFNARRHATAVYAVVV